MSAVEDLKIMPLAEFLKTVSDGDEHGWDTEMEYLRQFGADHLARLTDDIRRNGIREPIHIGNDGRCWDGHHRVTAALNLGLTEIPVRDDRRELPRGDR